MSSPFWQRFPIEPELHSLEMKDRLQERVMEDTRGAAAAALVAYFREASRRFRHEADRAHPESVASPVLVRDADQLPGSD
jgi:hypothetical protein